jgi:multidrug resistance efflux pump
LQEYVRSAEAGLKSVKGASALAAALGAGKVAPGSLAEAEYRLAEARMKLRTVEARIREAVVRAPGPVVLEVVAVRRGDLVPPFQPVIRALRPDEAWVQAYVPADELARLRPNQAVEVAIAAFPSQRFAATLVQISGAAEFTPRNVQSADERRHQVFGVKARVNNPQGVFKSGMTVDVFIPLPEQEARR